MRIKSIPRMNAYYIIINIFFFFRSSPMHLTTKTGLRIPTRIYTYKFSLSILLHLLCTIFELLVCDPVSQYSIQYFNRSQTMTTHNKFNQYTREIFRTIIYDIIFFKPLYVSLSIIYLHLEFTFLLPGRN